MLNQAEGEADVFQDLASRRRWTKLGNAPREILCEGAVVAWDDSRAIITGGDEYGEAKDSALIYNKDTMETETLPSMLQARFHHAAVIVGGNLFVIGGYGPNGFMDSIEVLDLNDPREFKLFPVRLRMARHSFSAVAGSEHEVYIIGGFGNGGQLLDSVEILNISTETISQGPAMLAKRSNVAAALVGDSIVVTGGWQRRGPVSASEKLSMRAASDEEARRWQPLQSNMTTERCDHHGVSYGDCMVVSGGYTAAFSPLRTAEVWKGTTGIWTQLPERLPVEDAIRGFVKLGDDLLCFVGGRNPSVYCLFSASGLLEHQRRQIRFNELIADERVEIVIPLLLEGLGQRGWTSLFYECIRETNGRLIPRRRRSALGKRRNRE